MIAFRVVLNGKDVAVAGLPDVHVVHVIATSIARDPRSRRFWPKGVTFTQRELKVEVSGLATHADGAKEHVGWGKRKLKVGDRLMLEVVDVPQSTKPGHRSRAEAPSLEEAERKQLVYLKKKYRITREKGSESKKGDGSRAQSLPNKPLQRPGASVALRAPSRARR